MSNIDPNVDYAAEVVSRLSKDYAQLMVSVSETLARLRDLPKQIDDEVVLNDYASVIRDARDLNKRLESHHDAEKAPYLRSGQGVDTFFFGQMDRLSRRKKNDPAGGIDIAEARIDDFMQRKLRAEREERQRIAAEEYRRAAIEQERVNIARRAAAEAEAKAARARNEQTIAAHRAEAERQAKLAEQAREAAIAAQQDAEDSRIDALARAADMTRVRLDGGALATMADKPVVQITDLSKLDKDLLWPFLKEEAILSALKTWAKTKNYRTQMDGAVIELRSRGQVR